MITKYKDLRGTDLNLMLTFLMLIQERSVTRAAERLHLGQPTVSGALSRLREIFNDDLLIRTARGMIPTTRALALESEIRPAIERIRSALAEDVVFEPENTERTFTIGMTDWVEAWLMPRLYARLNAIAPCAKISVKATDPFRIRPMLESNEIDLGIGPFRTEFGWQKSSVIKATGFSCIFSPDQIKGTDKLTLEQFTRHSHLLVTYRGAERSFIDERLAEQGLRRHVGYTTPHFSTLPSILRQMPVIATVPEVLAQHWTEFLALKSSPPPLELSKFSVSMMWHAMTDAEPPLKWLRALVTEALS